MRLAGAFPLPRLLIQPLVENAILHGVERRVGPGTVILCVKPSNRPGYTMVIVTDDGPGMDAAKISGSIFCYGKEWGGHGSSKGTGIGIANVERRLRLSYMKDTEGLEIRSEEGQGTTILFEIPNEHVEGTEA